MKKISLMIVLLLLLTTAFAVSDKTVQRIEKYSGKNALKLIEYVESLSGEKADYCNFLLDNSSDGDLAVLTPDFIDENIEYAILAKELPFNKNVSEELFLHYVLPPRMSQEPFEQWRKVFYDALYPRVKDCKTIREAVLEVDLWYNEGCYFKQTSGRDMPPLSCIKWSWGRCEEMMILFMAAGRSVGIPVRSVSAPYWSFTDSNHAWVEVWTEDGWKVTEEGYPLAYGQTNWVTDTALRAPIVTSRCFGDLEHAQTISIDNHATKLNITSNYGETIHTTVKTVDENGNPIEDVNIILYATTFGGLFSFYHEETDENGIAKIELGRTTTWVTARKDSLFGTGVLSTVKGDDELTITLSNNYYINESFVNHFPLAGHKERNFTKDEEMIKRLHERRELVNLRRQKRYLGNKKSEEFIKHYPMPENDEDLDKYNARRDKFLSNSNDICDNASAFLYVYDKLSAMPDPESRKGVLSSIITLWDSKDLAEMPDTTAILETVNAYYERKVAYKSVISDSLWNRHVITPAFGRKIVPENGWEGELYKMMKPILTDDLKTTYNNVTDWLTKSIVVDTATTMSYYSGSLNPVEILNKRNINGYHKTVLYDSVYRLAGIPLSWKGFMEYFDGEQWNPIVISTDEDEEKVPTQRREVEITLEIIHDGTPIKAEPFKNFLLATMHENGDVSNTYFDSEAVGDKAKIKWFKTDEETPFYLVSFIRNENGDSDVRVLSVTEDKSEYVLNLETPKPLFDLSASWSKKTKKALQKLLKKNDSEDRYTLVFVRGKLGTEPQERMVEQLFNKKNDFFKKKANVIIATENRDNNDLDAFDKDGVIITKTKKIIHEEFQAADYPCIFLLDKKGKIVSSSKGYNLSIIGYMPKLIK